MMKTVLSLALMAMVLIEMGGAVNYTVGRPNGGWDESTNFQTWASSLTFVEGDFLIFLYESTEHDVTEVSKPNFDNCTASNPLQPRLTSGHDAVPLTAAGSRYFICGTDGHCINGMKVEITTIASEDP